MAEMIMNMKLVLPEELKLDGENELKISLPSEQKTKIEDLQLEISCGFDMLNKKLKISVCGDSTAEIPQITLSQMHQLKIDLRTQLPEEKGWHVTHLLVAPCQKVNTSITVGINILVSVISMAFGFLCQMPGWL